MEDDMKPQFVLGNKALADRLGAAVVGDPIENEKYVDDILGQRTATVQATTKGLMWYSTEGNLAFFLPGQC